MTGARHAGMVVLLVLVLAACGTRDDAAGAPRDVEASSSTTALETPSGGTPSSLPDADPDEATSALPSIEDEVIAAYEAAWDAVIAAYDPADPEHPDLLATHDGVALRRHQAILRELQTQGLSQVATTSESDPQVDSVTGDAAIVKDCIQEVVETLDSQTRETQGQPDRVTIRVRRRMKRIDGAWKLVRSKALAESC